MNYRFEQIDYKNNTLEYITPHKNTNVTATVAIVIHVFYSDIWQDELKKYLENITVNFDLYLTVPEGMLEDEMVQMIKAYPTATVYRAENRGRDVLPFLQVMHTIGIETYAYICKLHTKKTGNSPLGNVWRKLLYFDLIGSNKIVEESLNLFQTMPDVGMITGKNTILDSKRYTYGNNEKLHRLSKLLEIRIPQDYFFPAGTMFWTRADIIAPMVTLFSQNYLEFEEEAGQKDDTLAHAIERFFGILCQEKHQKIIQSPSDYAALNTQTLDELAALVLSQQYAGKDMYAAQKQYVQELEALTESMRLKNRLKRLLPKKAIFLAKKARKAPQKITKIAKVLKHNPHVLKKVFYYASRGELGYLFTKIREKSNLNLSQAEQLTEVENGHYFIPFEKEIYALEYGTIDIIIPVYNGYQYLKALFDSIEANTSLAYRLIVINDCSSDEKVKPYLLERLEKHPSAVWIDHEKNQGFLKSVNEAYGHVSNHFVLLNTDTEVPSFWLERLMYPILQMDKIASTTPFTNAGEIASFPRFVEDNAIFDGMQVDALDNVFKKVNAKNFYAEVPTGVGFCMGINYDVTQEIGLFVEDTFGKGYGEENDWCQRAIQQGYKNILVPNLFVYHKHGGSFSVKEKQKLLEKNAITLLERHPHYGKDVDAYIKKDPHKILRHLLVLRASNVTHPLYLVFDHALGGGANLYTQKRIEQYVRDEKNVLLVKYDYYSHSFTLTHQYKVYDFSFKITHFESLKNFIDTLNIQEIFINNLVSYKDPQVMLSYIHSLVERTEAKLVLPLHDFYMVCPSYNLLNEEGKYCDIPTLETCQACMQNNKQEWRNYYTQEVDMPLWRRSWEELLQQSSTILCFSPSSAAILSRAYPTIQSNKIKLIPHEVTDIKPIHIKKNKEKEVLTIGVLGSIDYIKGVDIIKQLVERIEKEKLAINVVVIGEITEKIKSKHFKVTGRYKREDVPKLIQKHQIDIFLIPSVWPETFSYTTQEIMMMGLPLMVFNLGAPAERAKEYTKGYVLEEISVQAILDVLDTYSI
ncbi:MAG: hypothetical protein DSZ12_05165 [Sulfurovum sp.]|nr:MAG: hypothetical protein DSZ12_05165 [Sulfurovum sp.]